MNGREPDSLSPSYPGRPIGSVRALARHLHTTPEQLERLAEMAPRLYRPNPVPKGDDGVRWTYDVREPLKGLHGVIKDELLRRVTYPLYLQGSIRDRQFPREPMANARLHAGRYLFIQEDAAGFFGSIGPPVVYGIWREFFGFAPEVADLLTRLTTHDGLVPEGARTSSYIANLALWDIEPELVRRLETRGLVYSRYVDDITISATHNLPPQEKTEILRQVYGMLARKGLRPKRNKHGIRKKGQAGGDRRGVIVTGYASAGDKPAVPKSERKRVRAQVNQIEREARTEDTTVELQHRYQSASSRVARIEKAGNAEGKRLRQKLAEVRPSVFPKPNRRDIYGG